MATLQELENGLRKAHEAGNGEHARAFAAEIRKIRAATAAPPIQDMPVVTSRPDGALTEAGWQAERDKLAAEDPLEGDGWYKRYLAGVGLSGARTLRGIPQAAVDAANRSGMNVGLALDALFPGKRGVGDLVSGRRPVSGITRAFIENVGIPINAKSQEISRNEAVLRRDEAPIDNNVAGAFGNIVGTVGQMFAPATALRGTALSRLLTPATIRGNALQGALVGAAQPVASQGERAGNTAIGGLAGGAGAAVPKAGGALLKLARGVVGRPTLSGAEARAAELVRGEATSLDKLMQSDPSAIPGVQRSLAEETLDPGIARLERLVRGKSNDFQPIDTANNAARVEALGRFAGDESTLRAAQQARTAASKPLLGEAYLDKGVDTGAIREFVEKSAADNATRPSVQSAILDVKKALDSAGDDVVSLYGVRKYIGDLLSGKAGGDKTYAKAASAELKDIQGVLDDEIAKKSPAFAKYLAAFKDGSKPINRMQIGQELMESGGSVLDPQTGLQVLTPAAFTRKARDLDAVAAKATGFKKARASDSLLPEDIATIRAVQDDLARQSFRATAGSGGNSQTAERLMLQDKIGSGLLSKVPVVGGFVEVLNTIGNQKVNTQLARMLAEPEYARKVLANLNKSDRAVVTKALIQLGGRSGAAVPALTE